MWGADSSYLEIGSGILPNNIAYYIDGTEKAAKKLKLKMNINLPEEATEEQVRQSGRSLDQFSPRRILGYGSAGSDFRKTRI